MARDKDKKARERAMHAAMEAANEFTSTGSGMIHSDVLGSYTGSILYGEPFRPPEMVYIEDDTPVQDADDL